MAYGGCGEKDLENNMYYADDDPVYEEVGVEAHFDENRIAQTSAVLSGHAATFPREATHERSRTNHHHRNKIFKKIIKTFFRTKRNSSEEKTDIKRESHPMYRPWVSAAALPYKHLRFGVVGPERNSYIDLSDATGSECREPFIDQLEDERWNDMYYNKHHSLPNLDRKSTLQLMPVYQSVSKRRSTVRLTEDGYTAPYGTRTSLKSYRLPPPVPPPFQSPLPSPVLLRKEKPPPLPPRRPASSDDRAADHHNDADDAGSLHARRWSQLLPLPLCSSEEDLNSSVLRSIQQQSLWQESRPRPEKDTLVQSRVQSDSFREGCDWADLSAEEIRKIRIAQEMYIAKPEWFSQNAEDQWVVGDIREKQFFEALICYHRTQFHFMTHLLEVLEMESTWQLCADERDFLAGAYKRQQIIKVMQERCKRIIIILSNEFIESDMFVLQINEAIRLNDGINKKVIPIVYEDCEIPKDLKSITTITYYDEELKEYFWSKLKATLHASLPMPSHVVQPAQPHGIPPDDSPRRHSAGRRSRASELETIVEQQQQKYDNSEDIGRSGSTMSKDSGFSDNRSSSASSFNSRLSSATNNSRLSSATNNSRLSSGSTSSNLRKANTNEHTYMNVTMRVVNEIGEF